MINIVKVDSHKEKKAFLNLVFDMYGGSPIYVPIMRKEEKKIFKSKYLYNKITESVFFISIRDNKVMARVQGIILKEGDTKRVRFTRFDTRYDKESVLALFDELKKWAKEKGATEIVGPYGYSCLERKGLLIDGHDLPNTYEEQYNYEYFERLVESCGFKKAYDFEEYELFPLTKKEEKSSKTLNLHQSWSVNKFIKEYHDSFFKLVNKYYENDFIPSSLDEDMEKAYLKKLKWLANGDAIRYVTNESNELVAACILTPSCGDIVNASLGKRTLPFHRKFNANKLFPEILDLYMISALDGYEEAIDLLADSINNQMLKNNIEHIETNLVFNNDRVIARFMSHFDKRYSRKRRCYILKVD